MEAREENGLRRLKENIMRFYETANREQYKDKRGRILTRTEKKGLYDLRNNGNIAIKLPDKSKGVVVMSRESYMKKATAMLDCQINYEHSEIRIEEIERCTRVIVDKLTENKLPVVLANALLLANCE